MRLIETEIKDLYVVEPSFFPDNRGYFLVGHSYYEFAKAGFNYHFTQDNQSKSKYGVIRGLHYQIGDAVQTKLVRAIQGTIYDVAVDCRKNSPTYGKWFGIELSEENNFQLLVPKGFAHGFSVLSETAVVFYKIDAPYKASAEKGIIYNDPKLSIDWKIPIEKIMLSDKDLILPTFENAEFIFNRKSD